MAEDQPEASNGSPGAAATQELRHRPARDHDQCRIYAGLRRRRTLVGNVTRMSVKSRRPRILVLAAMTLVLLSTFVIPAAADYFSCRSRYWAPSVSGKSVPLPEAVTRTR